MRLSRLARGILAGVTGVTGVTGVILLVIYLPLMVVLVNSFSEHQPRLAAAGTHRGVVGPGIPEPGCARRGAHECADRPARHRHRYRLEQCLPHHPGRTAVDCDRDRRPRHLLHRHRLQQRDRPAPAPRYQLRGGVGRPRRGAVDHVPTGHLPAVAFGAARGRPVGLRPQLRRDHRDDLHRGGPASRRCRSGFWTICSARARRRSSTSSPSFWC